MIYSLLMSDAATAHPDKTFSILRGGINRIEAQPNGQIILAAALFFRMEAENDADMGAHQFHFEIRNAENKVVLPEFHPPAVTIPNNGATHHLIMNLEVPLPHLGQYRFIALRNGQEVARWKFEAVELGAPQ